MGVRITFDEAPGRHDWNYWDAGIVRALDWLFDPAGSGQAGK
jgi:S-formylglutathione hydrolase FrmB